MEDVKGVMEEILKELRTVRSLMEKPNLELHYEFRNTYCHSWIKPDDLLKEVLEDGWRIYSSCEVPQTGGQVLVTLFRPRKQ